MKIPQLASQDKMLKTLDFISREQKPDQSSGDVSGKSFGDMLSDGIKSVDLMSKDADKSATALATGKSGNIHETMLKVTQSELAFKLMVQIRNRGLEAYNEVMRMQV